MLNEYNTVAVDLEAVRVDVENILKKFPQVAGAYLFGSSLGACRPDSDIDIGLVLEDIKFGERKKALLEAEIKDSFYSFNGHRYDILLLDSDNPIFSFRVIKEGRLIYVRNLDRITDVMEQVSRRYAESYPRYKAALQEIIAGVIAHDH